MKLLEIVELRSARKNKAILEKYLAIWLTQAQTDKEAQAIKIYKHVSLETDFSIHIEYISETTEVLSFSLGEQLSSALKEFGLVNYNIWVEQPLDDKQLKK